MEALLKIVLYNIIFIIGLTTCYSQDSTKQKQWLKASIAPTALMAGSIYTFQKNVPLNRFDVQQSVVKQYPNFHSSLDDYTVYAPIVFPYGLDFIKKGYAKTDFWNRSVILAKSELLMMAMVYPTKYLTKIERPDGRAYNSYPSGHTAQAFVAATFMHEELKHQSVWYSIGAYGIASSVGAYRILNNRHWISDVFAGAAVGILSTKIAYLTHRYKWGKKNNVQISFVPVYY